MPLSEVTGHSGTLAGTNGNSDFTHGLAVCPPGGPDTKQPATIGGTVIHSFSQQVARAHVRLNRRNRPRRLALSIDGIALDMRQALALGDIALDGAAGVDPEGYLALAPEARTLRINAPFTTLQFVPDTQTADYDLYVETDPPAVNCFTRGTRITTDQGDLPVEELMPGCLIRTASRGFQPLRWIGSAKVAATNHMAPVLFSAGTLGNARELRLSPHHGVVAGKDNALTLAKDLVDGEAITFAKGGIVEYFHILFDAHEIVFAEGARCESLSPDASALAKLSAGARQEIRTLFPELFGAMAGSVTTPPLARPSAQELAAPF